MSAKKQAVLDVGSGRITLAVQDDKYSNTLLFKKSADYDGFMDGEFLDADGLVGVIGGLLNKCQDQTFIDSDEILVGVPAEFTTVVCKTIDMDFTAPHKITSADLDALLAKGDTYKNHPTYEALNAASIYYVLDQGDWTVEPPLNKVSTNIATYASYVLAERSFIKLFDGIAHALGVRFRYVSSILTELLFVVSTEARDKGAILVDSGYISTGVVYAHGDGILFSRAFSLGSGNVSGDLTTCLNIPFEHAAALTRILNLSLAPNPSDQYNITVGNEVFSYSIKDVNEVAACRVQNIAETIMSAMSDYNDGIDRDTEILLAGDGLCIGGAKEILESVTGRKVRYIVPTNVVGLTKPQDTSLAGLLLYQKAKQPQSKINGFISFIKRLFYTSRRTK